MSEENIPVSRPNSLAHSQDDVKIFVEAVNEMIDLYSKKNLLDSSFTKPTKRFLETLPVLFDENSVVQNYIPHITSVFSSNEWNGRGFSSAPDRSKIVHGLTHFINYSTDHCIRSDNSKSIPSFDSSTSVSVSPSTKSFRYCSMIVISLSVSSFSSRYFVTALVSKGLFISFQ